MTEMNARYSAGQAAALVGFGSVAMIDYLQRSGVFHPRATGSARRGRGRERRYIFRDLLVLKTIKRLLDSGVSVAALKDTLTRFQALDWSTDAASLEGPAGIVRFLVCGRDHIQLVRNADALVDLFHRDQPICSFIIDLDQLHGELRDSLRLPTLRPHPAGSGIANPPPPASTMP